MWLTKINILSSQAMRDILAADGRVLAAGKKAEALLKGLTQ
jgi:hypothetical protein